MKGRKFWHKWGKGRANDEWKGRERDGGREREGRKNDEKVVKMKINCEKRWKDDEEIVGREGRIAKGKEEGTMKEKKGRWRWIKYEKMRKGREGKVKRGNGREEMLLKCEELKVMKEREETVKEEVQKGWRREEKLREREKGICKEG